MGKFRRISLEENVNYNLLNKHDIRKSIMYVNVLEGRGGLCWRVHGRRCEIS